MLMRSIIAMAAIWPAFSLAAPPADPVQPQAEVPPVVYRSAFSGYQSMSESEKTPDKAWHEANETVASIGGHAGYLREGKETDKSSASPAATPNHAH